MKDKLTVKEAAEYLKTTRQKISRLIKRGVLTAEANPLDTRYKLIDRSALDKIKEYEKYLEDDQHEPTSEPPTEEPKQAA